MRFFARLVAFAAPVTACSVYDASLLSQSTSGSGGRGGAPSLVDGSASGGATPDQTDASVGGDGAAPANCGDGLANGGETDVDCGGPCDPCSGGAACLTGADCSSDRCEHAVCAEASCTDGVRNGTESDVDCGGTCSGCSPNKVCARDADCLTSVCLSGACQIATCTDGVKNGVESDVDCAGACTACTAGRGCHANTDCVSLLCVDSNCQTASCADGVKNGVESDADCGGSCSPCALGRVCRTGSDCASASCDSGQCVAPTCSDSTKNGTESDVDCGGSCPLCANGRTCKTGADCGSTFCSGGVCTPPGCNDGLKNGAESDTDCGGSACGPCANGAVCGTGADCASENCQGARCSAATCSDTLQNGAETGVDCGGATCGKCGAGQGCGTGLDCTSGVCTGTQCQAPRCSDGVKNGAEIAVDCGGNCAGCAAGTPCTAPGDCLSGVCKNSVCQAATCSDGVKNGAETSVDCGGTCLPCGFRKPLTLQGAQVTANLTDFPVLVSLVDPQLAASARADGNDIFFRDSSGAQLDAEVESFTLATGRLTAWVRLPSVTATTNTVFYLYYGDTAKHWNNSLGQNPVGVWRNGYMRVWHLQNVGNLEDSASTGNATNNGAANTTGLIGGAAYFDGTDNLYASHAALDNASFTVSVWLKRADTGADRCVLAQGRIGAAPAARQLFHLCYEQDPNPAINNHFRFGFWSDDLVSTNAYTDTANYELWTGTYDVTSNARALYRNGASEGKDIAGGSLGTGTDPLEFGRRVYFWDYNWKGNLDELRISNVSRPASWIAAEYANQRAGSTFLTVGAQETL